VNGTPASICGKYCSPIPISAVSADWTNSASAPRTESHFVAGSPPAACPGNGSSIDPDVSSMMNRSRPICSVSRVSPRHAAPPASPSLEPGSSSPKSMPSEPGVPGGIPPEGADSEPLAPASATCLPESDEHPMTISPSQAAAD
jgi:hypothetical protein